MRDTSINCHSKKQSVCIVIHLDFSSPFYKHELTQISAWMSNRILSKVWDEIIYPFSNFNSATIDVWMYNMNI